MQDTTLTAAQASERLAVSPHVIGMWASRGWINEHGTRQQLAVSGKAANGARLFHWDELLIAERDTRRKTNRSHRRTGYTQCPA